mgnify:CR=1 FL=1
MPNEEWGTKRLCPTSGKRFYDMNRDPIVSPYTGDIVEIVAGKSRMISADAADAETVKAKKKADGDEDVVLDDDDTVDVDLDDDLLEDDDDDVSLEEIADVPVEEDE